MTFRQFAYRNVVRNSRIYAAFFMASVSSVMVFFIYSMLMYHPRVENEFISDIAFRGMYFAQIVLVLFMLFFLFYSMRAFLEARSKEFGMLMHLGMEKQQLNKLVTLETMLIGFASIVVGILFGFAFSKFFFMVIREILQISALPVYFSWKPFTLTIATFATLFIVISQLSVWTIKDQDLVHLLRGTEPHKPMQSYSKLSAITGLLLLLLTYYAMIRVDSSNLLLLVMIVPPIMLIGTYLFFTDTILYIIDLLRRRKKAYWKKYHLIAWSEYATMLRTNAKMFFISSIVTTLVFLAIGTLSSMSAFTHQYHQINPVSIVYSSKWHNQYEEEHIQSLERELQFADLDYSLIMLNVKTQTSTSNGELIQVVDEEEFNRLALSLELDPVTLGKGEATYLPTTEEAYKRFKNLYVKTILKENRRTVTIDGAYPKTIFSPQQIGANVIILNKADFAMLKKEFNGTITNKVERVYAFNVYDWTETQFIGRDLDEHMVRNLIASNEQSLPFYYENIGIDYEVLRSTFALILFIGILASSVFFLAAGSFIYFKLYATLEKDRLQYATLRRLGITESEIRHLVNRQLVPQFFLPWTVAVINSSFAFMALQVFWEGIANISIVKTLVMTLLILTSLQFLYFYLIRWRYLAHLK